MSKEFTSRQGGGQKLNRLKRKSFGVIAIEVCFTLPVVVYLVFFTIELIKINITQDALQSICEEATYLTIAHDYENGADLIKKIDAIIEKYRPVFIPEKAICPAYGNTAYPVIRYHFETYSNFEEMLKNPPYGGSTPIYVQYETDELGRIHGSDAAHYSTQYLPIQEMQYGANPNRWKETGSYMRGEGLPNNIVFVITFVCNYPFSNSLVKWLFNRGVNTKFCGGSESYSGSSKGHKDGSLYLLWARGSGIVNAK